MVVAKSKQIWFLGRRQIRSGFILINISKPYLCIDCTPYYKILWFFRYIVLIMYVDVVYISIRCKNYIYRIAKISINLVAILLGDYWQQLFWLISPNHIFGRHLLASISEEGLFVGNHGSMVVICMSLISLLI
jgi:hypothetical protein